MPLPLSCWLIWILAGPPFFHLNMSKEVAKVNSNLLILHPRQTLLINYGSFSCRPLGSSLTQISSHSSSNNLDVCA